MPINFPIFGAAPSAPSDPNAKGWYATEALLIAAYPTGAAGWFAVVGATDTVWVWSAGSNAWVDSGTPGSGDVAGPAVAVDEHLPVFDGVTGKFIKDSGTAIADLEPALGDPASDDYLLSSLADGTRSWIPQTAGAWGSITGTLSDQTDLQTSLSSKKIYHGIESVGTTGSPPESILWDQTGSARTITLVAPVTYWYKGTRVYSAVDVVCNLLDVYTGGLTDNNLYYISFEDTSGILKASQSMDLKEKVSVCMVFWNGTDAAVTYELHNHERDLDWHINAHLTIGTRYRGGLAVTSPTNVGNQGVLNITEGIIVDEDIHSTLLNAKMTSLSRIFYQVSAGVFTFENSTLPYAGTIGAPTFIDTTGAYTPATFAAGNQFACYWVYGTADIDRPIYIYPTHANAAYGSIALARAEAIPTITGVVANSLNPEMKLLYRWIYKGDGAYQEVTDYRMSSTLPAGGVAPATAGAVTYSNVSSGLTATNVQAAIDEVVAASGIPPGVVGIHWDKTTDTVTRIGDTVADFSTRMPWAGIRRCNLADAGTVNDYHGDPGYIEDGSNGQCMVEYPKFWASSYKTATGIAWLVADEPFSDFSGGAPFEVHPAFMEGAVEVDFIYDGAYEGCLYDVSATAYLAADEQVGDFTVTSGDKLSSIAGVQPASGSTQTLSLVNSRIIANNRGAGWSVSDFLMTSARTLLAYIEYGTFNLQTAIGNGICGFDAGSGTSNAQNTGHTASLGNASGESAVIDPLENGLTGSGTAKAVSYRGCENPWGNIWKWVDGLNIQADHKPWVNFTNQNYESGKFEAPYTYLGEVLLNASDYPSDILHNSILNCGFLATVGGGGSDSHFYNYYSQATGNRAALVGGDWNYSLAHVGASYWSLSFAPGGRNRIIGARLSFR